jgi:hypothetical protein
VSNKCRKGDNYVYDKEEGFMRPRYLSRFHSCMAMAAARHMHDSYDQG